MKKTWTIPLFAILAGVVGFFLRAAELRNAFDELGLHITGAGISTALMIFSLAVVLIALLLAYAQRNDKAAVLLLEQDEPFRVAMGFEGKILAYIVQLVAAVLLIVSGFVEVIQAPYYAVSGTDPDYLKVVFPALLGFFSIIAGAMMATIANSCYTGKGKSKYLGRLLLPAYMGCFWLLSAHKSFSSNPDRFQYAYQLFAIIFALFAFYYYASFSFERPKLKRFTFSAIGAVYFCMLSQADAVSLAGRMRFGAVCLFLLITLYTLYQNLAELPTRASIRDSIAYEPETLFPDEQDKGESLHEG